ncbi:MAG: alpha/beta hydrolase [Legionellaceae bacterium]|nr:alpha/beta hydrolase [Legionellaceae bacterium]
MSMISKNSFIHTRLQKFTAGLLFPAGKGDWYQHKGYGQNDGKMPTIHPCDDFCTQQKSDKNAFYHEAFTGLDIHVDSVSSQLANGQSCTLEHFSCCPVNAHNDLPGQGKHILYFPGANTYYQACFRDISAAAKETGAHIHAFNFPGTGLSTGQVREANDLTNAGLAMVQSLLKQGIHPDDIILQGDCFGAAIAMEVKEQLARQANLQVRLIMNNAFKSFKAAVQDMITSHLWIPARLKSIVKALLQFTGWHITPGKNFVHSGPYQCHIKHESDLVLPSGTLSDKVRRMRNSDKEKYCDTCPEEYKEARDHLERGHVLQVKEEAKERLGKKFGRDKYGRINAHFADLCEMETQDGKPAYRGFVNQFIQDSNHYIARHPQNIHPEDVAARLRFINQAPDHLISRSEAEDMQSLHQLMDLQDESDREHNLEGDREHHAENEAQHYPHPFLQ